MVKKQIQTRVHQEKLEYLSKILGTNNLYRINEQAVEIACDFLRTQEKLEKFLDVSFDDPVKFLGVIEAVFQSEKIRKLLDETLKK